MLLPIIGRFRSTKYVDDMYTLADVIIDYGSSDNAYRIISELNNTFSGYIYALAVLTSPR